MVFVVWSALRSVVNKPVNGRRSRISTNARDLAARADIRSPISSLGVASLKSSTRNLGVHLRNLHTSSKDHLKGIVSMSHELSPLFEGKRRIITPTGPDVPVRSRRNNAASTASMLSSISGSSFLDQPQRLTHRPKFGVTGDRGSKSLMSVGATADCTAGGGDLEPCNDCLDRESQAASTAAAAASAAANAAANAVKAAIPVGGTSDGLSHHERVSQDSRSLDPLAGIGAGIKAGISAKSSQIGAEIESKLEAAKADMSDFRDSVTDVLAGMTPKTCSTSRDCRREHAFDQRVGYECCSYGVVNLCCFPNDDDDSWGGGFGRPLLPEYQLMPIPLRADPTPDQYPGGYGRGY
eukprot:494734-Amorphochlora_amoeboformis.AAC.3